MNIKRIIENLIDEIQKDGKLGAQFEKEPVKTIENLLGIDLPDEAIEKISGKRFLYFSTTQPTTIAIRKVPPQIAHP